MMRLSCYVIFIVWIVIVTSREAMAYLDPGTGSMLLQLLLGGVAGILMVMKLYWKQLQGLLRRKKPKEPSPL